MDGATGQVAGRVYADSEVAADAAEAVGLS